MTNTLRVTFDARSASTARLTGWERYTRGILSIVSTLKSVNIIATPSDRVLDRLVSDVRLPWRAGKQAVLHCPSYPPGFNADLDRTVATVHDLTWWKFPETASFLGTRYYRPLAERAFRSRVVVTVSNSVRGEILERWPAAQVHVISPFVTFAPDPSTGHRLRSKPYFLAVGSIEPRKNLARLAEAFRLADLSSDFDLVIVGRSAWGELPSGVQHVQSASDDELQRLFRHAQAVMVPSLYEGFGLPVAEALALGTPVHCSDIPVFREVAGSAAKYFSPTDIESISESFRIGAYTEKPGEVRAQYTRARTAEQLFSLYRDLGIDV